MVLLISGSSETEGFPFAKNSSRILRALRGMAVNLLDSEVIWPHYISYFETIHTFKKY